MIAIHPEPAPATGTKILEAGIASDLALKTPLGIRVVSALVGSGHLREDERSQFETCFEEAIINSIVHGNQEDPRRQVTVRAYVDGDDWQVHVIDEGEGFELSAITDPTDPDFPWLEHGRGIHMIRHIAGGLEYWSGGRTAVIAGTCATRAGGPGPVGPVSPAQGGARSRGELPRTTPKRSDGTVVARLLPDSAGETVTGQIEKIAAQLGEQRPPLLVLDLSSVPYLASSGIGGLVRLAKTCLRTGSRFAIAGVSNGLQEMLSMMQLDRFITICDCVEDAIEGVR